MYFSLVDNLFEMAYAQIMDKQKSIVKLWPQFADRMKQVASKSVGGGKHGVQLIEQERDIWSFLVPSGTKANKSYIVRVKFGDIFNVIKKSAENPNNWKRDKQTLNLANVARDVIYNSDLQISSDSPGDKWWGHNTIRTDAGVELDYKNPYQPDIRNPEKLGIMGKHAALVFQVLPFYSGDMASHLNRFFEKEIVDIQGAAIKKNFTPKNPQQVSKKEEPKQDTSVKPEIKPENPGAQPSQAKEVK